jgi:hypothetical protein
VLRTRCTRPTTPAGPSGSAFAIENGSVFLLGISDAQSAKIGVRKTVWDLDVYAWTFIDANQTSAAGLALFDHING